MNLSQVAGALNTNQFFSEQLDNLDVFLELHEGKTLFELLASQPRYDELMNAALLRFVEICMQHRDLETFRKNLPIFLNHFSTMLYYLGQRESLDRLNVIAQDVTGYFSFMNRESKSWLESIAEYLIIAPSIPGRLRSAALVGQMTRLTQNCHSLEELYQIKPALELLAKHPLFQTHFDYFGWGIHLLTVAAQIIVTNVPDYPTEGQQFIQDTVEAIRQLQHDLFSIEYADIKQSIAFLVLVYRCGHPDLQPHIVEKIEHLIQEHQEDSTAIMAFLKCGIGVLGIRSQWKMLREQAPPILSQLSPESNMILIKNLQFDRQSDTDFKRNLIATLEQAQSPFDLTFSFKPETLRAELKLARFISQGNYPYVRKITLELNTDVEKAGFYSMVGRDNIVLKPGSTRGTTENAFTHNCRLIEVFASHPSQASADISCFQQRAQAVQAEPTATHSPVLLAARPGFFQGINQNAQEASGLAARDRSVIEADGQREDIDGRYSPLY